MDPGKRNGRTRASATVSNNLVTSEQAQHNQPAAVLVVHAAAFGPCAGRSLWSYAVRCPRCAGTHLHRAGPPREDGHLRKAPCQLTYRVLARTVLPSLEVVA